jgi:hypothetical protein
MSTTSATAPVGIRNKTSLEGCADRGSVAGSFGHMILPYMLLFLALLSAKAALAGYVADAQDWSDSGPLNTSAQ